MNSVILYVICFFVVFIVEFGMNSYFSHSLSVEEYLYYQNIINILPFFIAFLSLGTPFGVVYLGSLKKEKTLLFLQESNLLVLLFSLLTLLIVSMLAYSEVISLYILVAFLLAFFNVIKQNSVNYFLASKRLNSASFIRLNQKLVYGVTAVLLVNVLTASLYNLSLSLVVGEVVGFFILVYKYDVFCFRKFTKIKSILKVSKYSFFSNSISMLSISLPIILLNYYEYPPISIISFAIAYGLLKYCSVILGPFMQLITPYFTPIKQDKDLTMKYFRKFFCIILLVSIGVLISVYFAADYLIDYFFDVEYKLAKDIFKVLIFSVPFVFLNAYVVIIISSIQSIKLTFMITVLGFMFSFILLAVFISLEYSLLTVSVIIISGYVFDLLVSLIMLSRFARS